MSATLRLRKPGLEEQIANDHSKGLRELKCLSEAELLVRLQHHRLGDLWFHQGLLSPN